MFSPGPQGDQPGSEGAVEGVAPPPPRPRASSSAAGTHQEERKAEEGGGRRLEIYCVSVENDNKFPVWIYDLQLHTKNQPVTKFPG